MLLDHPLGPKKAARIKTRAHARTFGAKSVSSFAALW
jgi:hypothetical protein